MTYEPKTWATGEVITADALNHIEGGVAIPSTVYVTINSEDGEIFTADKTFNEIQQAYINGSTIIIVDGYNHRGCGLAYFESSDRIFLAKIPYGVSDAQGSRFYVDAVTIDEHNLVIYGI